MNKKVFFIGAGPGDPELITLKGRRIIDASDTVIYTGSLVNPDIMSSCKKEALLVNSAVKTLEEVIDIIIGSINHDKSVARVHTGDPSIFGAIREQIDILENNGIECEVVPGVSSFTASAAALQKEFTLPGVSQTVICTRLEGRTPVPEKESLDSLASHRASMAIFLSVQMIEEVVDKLLRHYPSSTKVAVVQKATWEDQKIIQGTLEDIAAKVKNEDITKTAQILVGDFLGDEYNLSKLYDKSFSHMYRKGIHDYTK